MRNLILLTSLLFMCSCTSIPPTPNTVLQPDLNKPIIISGCEEAKREGRNVDC